MKSNKIRVVIFIANLSSGGKERRVVELLTFLSKSDRFEFHLVLTQERIHYQHFYSLDIPVHVIRKKREKNDFSVFSQFYRICKNIRPDIIHTWGRMQTFYAIPAAVLQGIKLVNSQITSAPPKGSEPFAMKCIDRLNFLFSKFILSNSRAGIEAYNPPQEKVRMIYNGINMNRFDHLPDPVLVREKYGIETPYLVTMVASFSKNKDYDMFYRIACKVLEKRRDITFLGLGSFCDDDSSFRRLTALAENNPRILFPGKSNEVEAVMNASDVGVLFSNVTNHGEGISNSIMEFMSVSRPVIANDAGGTREILADKESGYLITHETDDQVVDRILELINDPAKRKAFGRKGREIIDQKFSLESMGRAFEEVYLETMKN